MHIFYKIIVARLVFMTSKHTYICLFPGTPTTKNDFKYLFVKFHKCFLFNVYPSRYLGIKLKKYCCTANNRFYRRNFIPLWLLQLIRHILLVFTHFPHKTYWKSSNKLLEIENEIKNHVWWCAMCMDIGNHKIRSQYIVSMFILIWRKCW